MTKEQGDGDARFSKTQENLWNQIWVSRSSHTELQIKPNGTLADRIFDLFFCKCSPSSPHCSYLVISNRRRMNARGFSWNQMFASQMALQPVSLSTHLRVVTGTQTSWSSISGVYLGVRRHIPMRHIPIATFTNATFTLSFYQISVFSGQIPIGDIYQISDRSCIISDRSYW